MQVKPRFILTEKPLYGAHSAFIGKPINP